MRSRAAHKVEQLDLDCRPHLLGRHRASPADRPRGYLDRIGYGFRRAADHLGSDPFPERPCDLDGVTELLRRDGLAAEDTGIEISHPLNGSARLGRLREANDPALWIDQQPA